MAHRCRRAVSMTRVSSPMTVCTWREAQGLVCAHIEPSKPAQNAHKHTEFRCRDELVNAKAVTTVEEANSVMENVATATRPQGPTNLKVTCSARRSGERRQPQRI